MTGGTAPLGPGDLVLLTGASGFVGRHLAGAMVKAGLRVRAASRRPLQGLPETVEQVPLGDLAAPQDWPGLLAGVAGIVHGAGIAHAGPGLPDALYERVNRDATLALGRAAEGRARRLVFLSSIRAQTGPSARSILTEETPAEPTDAYGRSKLAAEQGLAALGLAALSLRPVVVYGEGVRGNVGQLLRLARVPVPLPVGGLTAPRSLLAVENLASAVLLGLTRPEPLSGPFITADPGPLGVGDLVRSMRRAMGRSPWVVPVPERLVEAGLRLAGRGEAWERLAGGLVADPSRLLSAGWTPPAPSTREGLRRWLEPRGPRA